MRNLLEEGKKFMSVDAETDGLWGQPFAVAAVVYQVVEGVLVEQDRICLFYGADIKSTWVKENVLPTLDMEPTNSSYHTMLEEFAHFYLENKSATVLWHMGHVVEAFLFRELQSLGLIGEWDAPYTPVEVATMLQLAGYDPSSVDSYARDTQMVLPKGSTHNPLYDCIVAARVFEALNMQIRIYEK